jgi:hypothetical protein
MAKTGRLRSRLLLTFFGLTSEYRKSLFKQIHEIVYYGGGGYDWYTVYKMPIWLRKFTYQSIVECKQKESDAYKGVKSSIKVLPRLIWLTLIKVKFLIPKYHLLIMLQERQKNDAL